MGEEEEADDLTDFVKQLANREPEDGFSEREITRMRTAFSRFKVPDSADLHTDDISGLLQYLGHVALVPERVKPLVKDVTVYDYMDFDEFLTFMQAYCEYERSEFKVQFEKFDEDNNEEISVPELKNLCGHLGFMPMKNMMQEALAAVDQDSNGQLGFDELVTFLAVYRHNEGFTRKEVSELRRSFDRFVSTTDHAGPKMAADSLCDALVHVFGLQVVEQAKKFEGQLMKGHGIGRSSIGGGSRAPGSENEYLHFPEFLIFARRTREGEMNKMKTNFPHLSDKSMGAKSAFARPADMDDSPASRKKYLKSEFSRYDTDKTNGISQDELRQVLHDMDYTPLRQNIYEIFSEVIDSEPDKVRELDFNEFFEFMTVFRARDGFLKDEVDKMRKVFDRFDDDQSGEINALELADLMRHLGYSLSLDEIHILVQEVDANGSNNLDFREYLHLMRLHREQELDKTQKIFSQWKDEEGLDRLKIGKVLEELGHSLPAWMGDITHKGSDHIDFDSFVMIVDSCREELVKKQRKKAGFTDAEIDAFENEFNTFDTDKSGMIDVFELQNLLKAFGWEPKSKEEQRELMKKLDGARKMAREAHVQGVGKDGCAELGFWEFVQLARMLHTQHDKAEEDAMAKLQKELNFTQQEVDEFRRVFKTQAHRHDDDEDDYYDHHHDHHHHHPGGTEPEGIPRDQVRRLVRQLGVAITPENRGRLDDKLAQLDQGGVLNFMSFLRLMKWLVDTDFAGINSAAAQKK